MAKDLRGEICGCLPLRPIMSIIAVTAFAVGAWHIIEIILGLMTTSEWGATFDYAPSCQGSACHRAFRNQLVSCSGNRATTFKFRYIIIGIFGMCFGALGFQGMVSRSPAMVKSFGWYLIFLAVIIAVTCVADNVYVLGCYHLSLNMERDIGSWIPGETVGLLRAQGHKDLSALTANKLKDLLGYDFLPLLALCYTAVVLIILYFSFACFQLAHVLEAGPVGLGANFLINHSADREVNQMKDRLLNVAVEYMNPLRHYESFGQLQDANSFPYLTKYGNHSAMQYGSVGAARPLPKESSE